eukprot:803002-Rhodomonas_salina.2
MVCDAHQGQGVVSANRSQRRGRNEGVCKRNARAAERERGGRGDERGPGTEHRRRSRPRSC